MTARRFDFFDFFPGTHEAMKSHLDRMLAVLFVAMTRDPGPKFAGYDLREWFVRFISDEDKYKLREKWKAVLMRFPKEKLTADERDLLSRGARRIEQLDEGN